MKHHLCEEMEDYVVESPITTESVVSQLLRSNEIDSGVVPQRFSKKSNL